MRFSNVSWGPRGLRAAFRSQRISGRFRDVSEALQRSHEVLGGFQGASGCFRCIPGEPRQLQGVSEALLNFSGVIRSPRWIRRVAELGWKMS